MLFVHFAARVVVEILDSDRVPDLRCRVASIGTAAKDTLAPDVCKLASLTRSLDRAQRKSSVTPRSTAGCACYQLIYRLVYTGSHQFLWYYVDTLAEGA